ncbi:hypothetical protein ACHAXA_009247 [Cyclostephanos tholiformis]|uniref:VWFA domain-containing protein n=1 Tax=Cyclostephanos tholiformis TaxID=382380 RepID=A0ABD3RQ43_9STRA
MTAPKKYVKINGVMKLNPEYKRWQESQTGAGTATSLPNSAQALPVVSSMEDHMQLNSDLGTNIPLAEATDATIEMMQDSDFCADAGMNPDTMVDELGSVLSKYEVPMGLMNKLMMLSEFHALEFIIDDSGSMQCATDSKDPVTHRPMSRWKEASIILKELIEILAYIPFNQIVVEFLNRRDQVILTRQGRAPALFIQDANSKIDAVFARGPAGTTPALEKLQESLIKGQGKSIARYFFGDGTPNGGERAQKEIINILRHRQAPAANPMTFISCTNEDDQVEWMKDAEELCPYCSESDDFKDEGLEVLKDQGAALPYTKGFHLICTLVAAMNPDDLDAMDESVPFTKNTLDNLLGIQHPEESYRYYFDCFVQAQRARKVEGPMDQLKKNVQWNYNDFLRAPMAKDIPQVQQFKQQLHNM